MARYKISILRKSIMGNPTNHCYSEVPNRRADRKNSTLPAFLLSKLINEQGGIFCLLHEKLQAGWKENLKNLSEHALLRDFRV